MPGISVNKIPIPFRKSGINWSSHWTQQLSRNTDVVEAAGYVALSGPGAFGVVNASRGFLNKNNLIRIRQSGTITRIGIRIGAIDAKVTEYFIQVWRKDGSTYDLIGEEDIRSRITLNETFYINLNNPINSNKGDYLGIVVTATATIPFCIVGNNISTANSLRFIDRAHPTGNDYNWDAGTAFTYNTPIKAFMQSPLLVLIGDSIIAGHPTNYSFIENSLTEDATCEIGDLLKAINSKYVCQNMGIGPQTSTAIAARFAADVVALKPKIVVINGGVNDIAGGAISKATFLSNYTAMLDACVTNDIMPVVCKILPWTNGTNEQMQTRDEWMTDLQALVNSATYNGAVWVDFDTAMGKNRASGDAGNLWDLQTTPDYDNDGIHPTALGYAKMAEVIDAAIVAKGYQLV